ncbi:hypothetical protein KQI61_11810 [Anaerocolumna aminovalerica]|jgi:hypothetical protein|uniref:hypothetical protein n=1 Tax=Anaerocolumna aminovalerica TaxID=1527 RepID=UPI001C0EC87F|nr:hypothetical protein [Anaerocolumna aminovalerica]MBU5332884.1 hypothetical protein [Anaerocolumna aminovalerica]
MIGLKKDFALQSLFSLSYRKEKTRSYRKEEIRHHKKVKIRQLQMNVRAVL